ncbi:hypothetical protein AV530_018548 [Patagioenas fasciata monilis]|uniref:Uncharacterized protein n=1 Tax=Patagioenas fasciata monilis TaxID=372326 RepID=A0A1V4JSK7_PATFA|nr:hypothetical protein AV530_018548 [Patagioenas fasciata monilis]
MVPSGSQLSERPRCGIYKGSRIGSKRKANILLNWRPPQHRQLQPSLSSFSLPALSSMTWFEDHLQGDQKEQREGDGKQEKRCGWRKLSQTYLLTSHQTPEKISMKCQSGFSSGLPPGLGRPWLHSPPQARMRNSSEMPQEGRQDPVVGCGGLESLTCSVRVAALRPEDTFLLEKAVVTHPEPGVAASHWSRLDCGLLRYSALERDVEEMSDRFTRQRAALAWRNCCLTDPLRTSDQNHPVQHMI